MFSIAELLARAKAGAGIESDYRLAKIIGVSHSTLSHYGSGYTLPNERVIEQLCALSGDDPGVIAAEIQAARSKTPEARALWSRMALRLQAGRARLGLTAIIAVLSAILLVALAPEKSRVSEWSRAQIAALKNVHIVCSTMLLHFAAWLERLRRRCMCFAGRRAGVWALLAR